MEISNTENLWELFGVTTKSSQADIDNSYIQLRNSGHYNKSQLRSAWKILRDPFFVHAYDNYRDVGMVFEAGFFDDLLEPEDIKSSAWDPNWLTTPMHKIRNNLDSLSLQNQNELAVLVSTGSFSPIHLAHIDMMNSAKKILEDKYGVNVLGGYLSPSHDGYVSTKYAGSAAQNIAHRIRLCEEAVSSSDWLMVDPWEGRYARVPVTYTDVIIRLDSYLKTHFPTKKIKIYYVFGSDNAAFARAFVNNGQCVCLIRPGYEDKISLIKDDKFLSKRAEIIVAKMLETRGEISSTLIRKGLSIDLPIGVKDIFLQWRDGPKRPSNNGNIYAIRDDLDWATSRWRTNQNKDKIFSALINFKEKFTNLLKEAFNNRTKEDLSEDVSPIFFELSLQQRFAEDFTNMRSTINLDVCTNAGYKLNPSRLFGISDGQCRSNIIVSRPFFGSMDDQFNKIPAGDYYLLDDDSATGFTYKKIIESLPVNVNIIGTATLLEMFLSKNNLDKESLVDVVDLRDFLFGTRDAGLVVLLPDGQIVRAPYVAPYVSLASRAKIPSSQEINFSIEILKLNLEFFESLPNQILLSEADPSFQRLMTHIGFGLNVPITEICRWHIDRLSYSQDVESDKKSS